MKWKAALCAVVVGITSFGTTPVQTVSAESENYKCEIPFVGRIWVERGVNRHQYYEIDMSFTAEISGKGDIIYTLYSQEDFSLEADTLWDIYSPVYVQNSIDDVNKRLTYGITTVLKSYTTPDSYAYVIPYEVSFDKIDNTDNKYEWHIQTPMFCPESGYYEFDKGEIIAELTISQVVGSIDTDNNGRCYTKTWLGNGEYEKNYLEGRTVELKIDDTVISRTLTNKSILNELCVHGTTSPEYLFENSGDVNGDGVFTISDVVMFQNWLLGKNMSDYSGFVLSEADLCRDNRFDVFDLCLMRRKLVELRSL